MNQSVTVERYILLIHALVFVSIDTTCYTDTICMLTLAKAWHEVSDTHAHTNHIPNVTVMYACVALRHNNLLQSMKQFINHVHG
jgi:hypothetical protein